MPKKKCFAFFRSGLRESNIPQSVIKITDALKKNCFVFANVEFLFCENNVAIVVAELTEGNQICVLKVFEEEGFGCLVLKIR